jgi:hypothetical protein
LGATFFDTAEVLTGTMDASTRFDAKTDLRATFPRMSPENLAKNMPFVDLLERVAAEKNATPSQIALAWLLAQKPWIVPIPGTRRIDHLEENLGGVDVAFTADDLGDINAALSKLTVHGLRMDELVRTAGPSSSRYFASWSAARIPASRSAVDSARSGVVRASCSVPARRPKKAPASARVTFLPFRFDSSSTSRSRLGSKPEVRVLLVVRGWRATSEASEATGHPVSGVSRCSGLR